MKAIRIHEKGRPEVLIYEDRAFVCWVSGANC